MLKNITVLSLVLTKLRLLNDLRTYGTASLPSLTRGTPDVEIPMGDLLYLVRHYIRSPLRVFPILSVCDCPFFKKSLVKLLESRIQIAMGKLLKAQQSKITTF